MQHEKARRSARYAGTGLSFLYSISMLSAAEYLLKAENCALAARAAHEVDERLRFIRLSAMYRNKALTAQLGHQSGILRRCPFSRDDLRPF